MVCDIDEMFSNCLVHFRQAAFEASGISLGSASNGPAIQARYIRRGGPEISPECRSAAPARPTGPGGPAGGGARDPVFPQFNGFDRGDGVVVAAPRRGRAIGSVAT